MNKLHLPFELQGDVLAKLNAVSPAQTSDNQETGANSLSASPYIDLYKLSIDDVKLLFTQIPALNGLFILYYNVLFAKNGQDQVPMGYKLMSKAMQGQYRTCMPVFETILKKD